MNTQTFPSLIGILLPLQPDEEDVSYDIESLLTNVPVKETIEYTSKAVYEDEKLPSFCSRQVFSKLLLKATTENLFTANGKLYKQKLMVSQWGTVIGCFCWMLSQLRGRKSSCATESCFLRKVC